MILLHQNAKRHNAKRRNFTRNLQSKFKTPKTPNAIILAAFYEENLTQSAKRQTPNSYKITCLTCLYFHIIAPISKHA